MTIKVGQRVKVFDGSGVKDLGYGIFEGYSTVYVKPIRGGILNSGEQPMEGYFPVPNNPRIRLDNGQVVYGCQVWWVPVEEEMVDT